MRERERERSSQKRPKRRGKKHKKMTLAKEKWETGVSERNKSIDGEIVERAGD